MEFDSFLSRGNCYYSILWEDLGSVRRDDNLPIVAAQVRSIRKRFIFKEQSGRNNIELELKHAFFYNKWRAFVSVSRLLIANFSKTLMIWKVFVMYESLSSRQFEMICLSSAYHLNNFKYIPKPYKMLSVCLWLISMRTVECLYKNLNIYQQDPFRTCNEY